MKKLAFGLVALALVCGVVGAQCGTTPRPTPSPTARPTTFPTRPVPPTPTPSPAPRTFINLNLGVEPPTIDPALSTDTASTQVCELLFLGLTDYDDETVEVVPELAERWEVSGDGLTWTFHLRRDVYWVRYDPAAGTVEKKRPVTAHDVEYAVKRALDPATAADYAYVLYVVKGAEAFNTQPVTAPVSADTVGVRALDDYTVEFETVTPAAYFPGIAGMWFARPVPREVVEAHAVAAHGDAWTEPGTIWTNGPYLLETWDHEEKMVMVKNPAHPAAASVQIDRINWFMVDELNKAMAMYEKGELDVTTPPVEDLRRESPDPILSKELHTAPVLCTYFYAFNTTEAPVDDVHVRRALSYAVDRQTICDAVLGNGQRPAKTFAPPGIFGSPAENPRFEGISFDPEMARQELELAGYPGGAGLPKLTLTFSISEGHQKIAQAIQANWKEHLGVEVEFEQPPHYWPLLGDYTPQIFRLTGYADYPDENNWILEVFHSTRERYRTKWSNAEFDRLVEEAAAETDPARRKALYFQAERILCVDEAAIIPIYYYTHVVLTKSYVTRTYAPLGAEHVDRWTVERP